jgi:hypothetical protein
VHVIRTYSDFLLLSLTGGVEISLVALSTDA